jgi:predicted amidohydrolase
MPQEGKRRLVRVVLHQAEPGSGFPPITLEALRALEPGVVVLPEYFWVRPEDRSARDASAHSQADRRTLETLSSEIDAIWVGGTLVEPGDGGRLHNTCLVFDRGKEVLAYRKRRLMPGEAAGGIHPGDVPAFGRVRGFMIGLLICADVFEGESYDDLAPHRPDLIAVPTNSPYRPDDPVPEKFERDRRYFVEGARRTGAHVLKACTVGQVFGRPVQGRSLIAAPDGVIARSAPDQERESLFLTAELSLPDCV